MAKEDRIEMQGEILENFPNATFKVKLENVLVCRRTSHPRDPELLQDVALHRRWQPVYVPLRAAVAAVPLNSPVLTGQDGQVWH